MTADIDCGICYLLRPARPHRHPSRIRPLTSRRVRHVTSASQEGADPRARCTSAPGLGCAAACQKPPPIPSVDSLLTASTPRPSSQSHLAHALRFPVALSLHYACWAQPRQAFIPVLSTMAEGTPLPHPLVPPQVMTLAPSDLPSCWQSCISRGHPCPALLDSMPVLSSTSSPSSCSPPGWPGICLTEEISTQKRSAISSLYRVYPVCTPVLGLPCLFWLDMHHSWVSLKPPHHLSSPTQFPLFPGYFPLPYKCALKNLFLDSTFPTGTSCTYL